MLVIIAAAADCCAVDVRTCAGGRIELGCIEGAPAAMVIVSVVMEGSAVTVAVSVRVLVERRVVVRREGEGEGQRRYGGLRSRAGGDTEPAAEMREGWVEAKARREGIALAGSTPSATTISLTMVSVDCSYAASKSRISCICVIETVLIPADCLWNMLECLLGHTYFARSPKSGSMTCTEPPSLTATSFCSWL
jgi:hypothetical protein